MAPPELAPDRALLALALPALAQKEPAALPIPAFPVCPAPPPPTPLQAQQPAVLLAQAPPELVAKLLALLAQEILPVRLPARVAYQACPAAPPAQLMRVPQTQALRLAALAAVPSQILALPALPLATLLALRLVVHQVKLLVFLGLAGVSLERRRKEKRRGLAPQE